MTPPTRHDDILNTWNFRNEPTPKQLDAFDAPSPNIFSQIRNWLTKGLNETNVARSKYYPDIVYYYCENENTWYRRKNW